MYSAFVTSDTHYARVGYCPTSTILPHLLRRSPAAEEKTIKLLSISRGPWPHLRQLTRVRAAPRSTCTKLGANPDRLRSQQVRLHHPDMHLRDASMSPNDPEILPRDREIYLSRRLLANAFGVVPRLRDEGRSVIDSPLIQSPPQAACRAHPRSVGIYVAGRIAELRSLNQCVTGIHSDYLNMPTVAHNHVRLDKRGVAWIDDTTTKVVEVALDQIAHGWSAEEIHFQHPHLSLGQIHAALAYYYDHKAEFDTEIHGSLERVEQLRAEAGESPIRKKLRALGKLA
jgi:uncharacterized protein (DUF433 family)